MRSLAFSLLVLLAACGGPSPILSGSTGGISYEVYAPRSDGMMTTTTSTGAGTSMTVGADTVTISGGTVSVNGEPMALGGNNRVRVYLGEGEPRVELDTVETE